MPPVRFETKRDPAVAAIFFATLLLPLALVVVASRLWSVPLFVGVPVLGPVIVLLVQWFGTHYTITDSDLVIRSGLYRARLPLRTVREVRYRDGWRRNVYGFSRQQLHVTVDEPFRHTVRISPVDRGAFVAALQTRSPDVKIHGLNG